MQNFFNSPSPIVKPDADEKHALHVTFDNNQKVGHTSGRIREGSSIPMSICTAVTYITPNSESTIQQTSDLCNNNWLDYGTKPVEKIQFLEKQSTSVFRRYRATFEEEIINEVFEDHSKATRDHIDIEIVQEDHGYNNIVCHRCRYVHAKLDTLCPNCQSSSLISLISYFR
jgi:hypothetical protein